jgi:tagatose-1,6-bisphosphate aldolase
MNPAAATSDAITLSAIADPDGSFAIVAMDQRNTLRRMFAAVGVDPSIDDLRQAKIDVARYLTPLATGILLDPDFGVPAVRESDSLAPTCGLLVAAEPSDRGKFNEEPRTHRIAEQNATWVRDMGGHAVKFLVMMNPARSRGDGEPDLTEEVLQVVREVVEDCRAVGLPSVIENLIYPLPGSTGMTDREREDAIVESAALLTELKPDLLKLEYPGSPAGCRRLADTVTVPWAVLSAGVDFDKFNEVIRVSCDDGGASGFIAGRSVWKEAIGLTGPERDTFLSEVAVPRLAALRESIAGRARPWFSVTPV